MLFVGLISTSLNTGQSSYLLLMIELLLAVGACAVVSSWPLTRRGKFISVIAIAVIAIALSRWIFWPLARWIATDNLLVSRLEVIASSEGFQVIVGAMLATLGGYLAWWWQERMRNKKTRSVLNALLRWELLYMGPRDMPIGDDPNTARRIVLNAVPRLLDSGILDPVKDEDLVGELVRMRTFTEMFNEKARTYDQAWAADAHPDRMKKLFEDLQMSNWDFRDSHGNVTHMIDRLGPPILNDEGFENVHESIRHKIERWVRQHNLVAPRFYRPQQSGSED